MTRSDLEQILCNARSVRDAAQARGNARKTATIAMRALMSEIQDALDGEAIRGLPNLGNKAHPFYGVQVRAQDPREKLKRPEPPNFHPTRALCVSEKGQLAVVEWHLAPKLSLECLRVLPATDDDLRAEDLEGLLSAVVFALGQHAVVSGRQKKRYERIANIAKYVTQLVEG